MEQRKVTVTFRTFTNRIEREMKQCWIFGFKVLVELSGLVTVEIFLLILQPKIE